MMISKPPICNLVDITSIIRIFAQIRLQWRSIPGVMRRERGTNKHQEHKHSIVFETMARRNLSARPTGI